MSTRESTTPPAVPTVTVDSGLLSERSSIITIARTTGRVDVAVSAPHARAVQLAAEIRGAIADAYVRGLADGRSYPNLADHEIGTEHGQATNDSALQSDAT